MIKKILSILIAVTLLAAMAPLSSAASDEVQPYNGWFGPDSPLYGLKLLIEDIDESLAGDVNGKLVKQMAHAETRLSEAYAMSLKNNTGAAETALNKYEAAMDRVNATMNDPGISDDACLAMSRQLEKHQNHFRYMINDSAGAGQLQNQWANAFDYSEQFRNGRPFVYCNDTAYFVPPGQMQKMNWSQVPPGLEKKGYQAPQPTVVDGNVVWPWDLDRNYSHDYNYSNQYDYGNGTCAMPNDYNYSYNNSNDYQSPGPHGSAGSGNGNANGNANAAGSGNGNGKK